MYLYFEIHDITYLINYKLSDALMTQDTSYITDITWNPSVTKVKNVKKKERKK